MIECRGERGDLSLFADTAERAEGTPRRLAGRDQPWPGHAGDARRAVRARLEMAGEIVMLQLTRSEDERVGRRREREHSHPSAARGSDAARHREHYKLDR